MFWSSGGKAEGGRQKKGKLGISNWELGNFLFDKKASVFLAPVANHFAKTRRLHYVKRTKNYKL